MKKFLIVCLTLLLTGPVFADGWTMPWDVPWTSPLPAMFGLVDMRSNRVDVLLGVKIMPPDELAALCGERNALLRGCITDSDPCCSWIFLPGELASEHVILFTVQHLLTYAALKVKCDNEPACFEDNVLYTMEYSTRGHRSEYRMGKIGDLLNEAFDLGIPYNGRVPFAQLFMGNLPG